MADNKDPKILEAMKRALGETADEAVEVFEIEDGVLVAYNGEETEVTVPAGVHAIGVGAFEKTEVVRVTLPEGVERIERYAFGSCRALVWVDLPESVTEVEDDAFQFCTKLDKTCLLPYYRRDFRRDPPTLTVEDGVLVGVAPQNAPYIEVPAGVTALGKRLFFGREELVEVVLPEGLLRIEDEAFANCYHLALVDLPASLESIGAYAFFNCNCLTESVLPESVTDIGKGAFHSCQRLASITLPRALAELRESTFGYCRALTHIDLPASLKSIGKNLFYMCDALETLALPETLTDIPKGAFHGCAALSSVVLHKNIQTVAADAFDGCGEAFLVDTAATLDMRIVEHATDLTDYTLLNGSLIVPAVCEDGEREYFVGGYGGEKVRVSPVTVSYMDLAAFMDGIATYELHTVFEGEEDRKEPPASHFVMGDGAVYGVIIPYAEFGHQIDENSGTPDYRTQIIIRPEDGRIVQYKSDWDGSAIGFAELIPIEE